MELPLRHGETVIQDFKPSFEAFLFKLAFVFGCWALVFLIVPSPLQWFALSDATPESLVFDVRTRLISAGVTSAFYMFIFGDFFGWTAVKEDRWILTNQRLVLHQVGEGQTSEIPLTDIKRVRIAVPTSLHIRLHNWTAIRIRYVNRPAKLRRLIQTAHTTNAPNPEAGHV